MSSEDHSDSEIDDLLSCMKDKLDTPKIETPKIVVQNVENSEENFATPCRMSIAANSTAFFSAADDLSFLDDDLEGIFCIFLEKKYKSWPIFK